ncbi:hypothetical protein H6769_07625 [Candidatus Peribacteria bacterium]|nr:hypothetical protein [Candidatus Peribacteria bacterium]
MTASTHSRAKLIACTRSVVVAASFCPLESTQNAHTIPEVTTTITTITSMSVSH